jgi:hypothetical protein
MPDPATLLWDEEKETPKPPENFGGVPREKVIHARS